MRKRVATGVVLVLSLVAACGSPAQPETETVDDAFAGIVAEAEAAGADEEQLDALADGVVTYDEYETSMQRAFACMRDQGFTVTVNGTKESRGVTLLDFQVAGTTAATDLATDAGRALMEDCTERHSAAVDTSWQALSPDAVAFNDRLEAALAPPLLECLRGYDVDVPDDATMHELVLHSQDLLVRDESKDCLTDVGYFTWNG
ncbi:hypothetical protein [Cellulomonas sp. SLBN-39]|uniref:hypothetical protein n=1 Tax=Cellulomonas sp. SLBN-39 TaxID=2768446 RepID=UPI00114F060A|nr:hypothetical protein [Cellulomonas sp. SLBN-39]TQL02508.1 hypothetical protein FBY24_1585 [Cellulomonas sp. SLBN-39]